MFRRLSRQYHWTPGQIGELTVEQLKMYLGGETPKPAAAGTAAARAARAQERQRREQWISDMLRSRPAG